MVTGAGATGPAAGGMLLGRLMRAVRPEFRADVFVPPRGNPVFFYGGCRVPSCSTHGVRPRTGLCDRHHTWWKADGRLPVEQWLDTAETRMLSQRKRVPECAVPGCNRASRRKQLCIRHESVWERAAGQLPPAKWAARAIYEPTSAGERDCSYPDCPRWADGEGNPLCALHWRRWHWAGKPEIDGWLAAIPYRHDPKVDLSRLGRRTRLELQFGLQCRSDEGTKITNPTTVSRTVSVIHAAGVDSLLDWDDDQWRAFTTNNTKPGGQAERSLVLDTCFHLRGLLIDDPWADQFPRDIWDLRVLGLNKGVRNLRFDGISQHWLRELVKRWCRWRLSKGLAPVTVVNDAYSCRLLSEHLARVAEGDPSPAALTRPVLESWLAALRVDHPNANTRCHRIQSVSALLRDTHRHEWLPELPRDARIYEDDAPRRGPAKHRWVREYQMRQLEAPASLERFPSDDGRLVLKILINCGLRLGDARRLPLDCVVRDAHDAPYLAWVNYKIRERAAFFPISEELAGEIAEQQRRTRERFPTGRWLFTRRQNNLNGSKPMDGATWQAQLDQWLRDIELADENGKPARITPHQFRHTVATRLINADVPHHVVRQLLDHMSPEMTDRYAKLHQETLRRHWETALKIGSDGQEVTIPAEHPLADAQWTRISLVRAKVTLPNGYCGAPVQTDCEFANPCLDCRFFITTKDFLDQHRRQREETRQLVSDAEQAGLSRVAEKNRRTAAKLDTIITTLEDASDSQVVVGGHTEDIDAAS